MVKRRYFLIKDINEKVIIEVLDRQKDIFDYVDEYIENMSYEWFYPYDDTFKILYKDGKEDVINADYDGHKIKRKGVLSMVYDNACTSVVYGNFAINEYGVVNPSATEEVAFENIAEIKE